MDIYNTEKDDFLDNPVASSMECTGLIPALPETEDELEFYEEMFPYLRYSICTSGGNIHKFIFFLGQFP